MSKPNYKQIYAMKSERESRIKKLCPNIPYSSGIYVFWRIDEAGIRRAYCGQAVKLCERCASHLAEYDHIALSLKKHGFTKKIIRMGGNCGLKPVQKIYLMKKRLNA